MKRNIDSLEVRNEKSAKLPILFTYIELCNNFFFQIQMNINIFRYLISNDPV
jgi:hypothetical protein